MFWVDRPSRSSVVMTRMSPSITTSSARSNCVMRLAPSIHRDPRRGHRVGRRRPEDPPGAGRWTATASKRVRSRSVSSSAAPVCLVTNGENTGSIRRFSRHGYGNRRPRTNPHHSAKIRALPPQRSPGRQDASYPKGCETAQASVGGPSPGDKSGRSYGLPDTNPHQGENSRRCALPSTP